MVDAEPIDVTPLPVTSTGSIDLAPMSLEVGKEYVLTTNVDASGVATTTVEEIIPPPPAPATDVVVFRHKKSGKAFLGQLGADGKWNISFSQYESWTDVLADFPPEFWNMAEVTV